MMNWLRKLVGLGGTAKNLTSLGEEECKEEIQAFITKTKLPLFEGNVQNLYSTQRIKETSVCPRCEAETERKVATFVCATDTLPQIIISTANHFCTNCSSVLIDDKLLQKSCEKGKVYRGIIGFYVKENIQTYQSLNEYIIRYHYDQNSNPNGIKITGDKISAYDPKIHGAKGTKNQHQIPTSPVTLMDRVDRRDQKESLNPSSFKKGRNNQEENTTQTTAEQDNKAARSERARLAIENMGKKPRPKPKAKEDFAASVTETKKDFKDKVEQKSTFTPKKRQKPVVENPNEKQSKQDKNRQDKQEDKRHLQVESNQDETENVSTSKQNPVSEKPNLARASQRKKQIPSSPKIEDENVIVPTTEQNQPVAEVKEVAKNEVTENVAIDVTEENAAAKKNRKFKHKRSTRKTRSNKRPTQKTEQTEPETSINEPKNIQKEESTNKKPEFKQESKTEPKQEPKKEQQRESNAQKQVNPNTQNKVQNKEVTTTQNENKENQNKEKDKKENFIEKLQQNLQESAKETVLPKEEKQKEQQKESSRLARLKQEDAEEKTSRRRPRSNVRPPIDLDLKNVTPRRRYNNTKKK